MGKAYLKVFIKFDFFAFVGFLEEQAEFDPQTVRPGSRYSHVQEVQERLNFLRLVF